MLKTILFGIVSICYTHGLWKTMKHGQMDHNNNSLIF